jgi:hypothetical protein
MTAQINKSTLKNQKNPLLATESGPEILVRPAPLKGLLEWRASVRPFRARSRDFWTTVLAVVILLSIILVFLKEFLLIAVMIAFVFVFYIFSTVPPGEVEHRITTRGVITGGRSYNFDDLGLFYFTEKWGERILNIERTLGLGGRLMMLLGREMTEEKIRGVLKNYLVEETPEPTYLDKVTKWLGDRFPLEER